MAGIERIVTITTDQGEEIEVPVHMAYWQNGDYAIEQYIDWYLERERPDIDKWTRSDRRK